METPGAPETPGGGAGAGEAEQLTVPDCSSEAPGPLGELPPPPRPARSLRAVYVLNDHSGGGGGGAGGAPRAGPGSPESGALLCLERACEAEGAQLSTLNFGELDFGETAVLDAFYDAVPKLGCCLCHR